MLKILQMKNKDVICCSPAFQVGYCIWHVRTMNFLEFDRPENCEGGAVE
jgi:hypothetical protein